MARAAGAENRLDRLDPRPRHATDIGHGAVGQIEPCFPKAMLHHGYEGPHAPPHGAGSKIRGLWYSSGPTPTVMQSQPVRTG